MSCHQNALRFRVENILCAVVFLSSYFSVCVCVLLLQRGWRCYCALLLIAIRSAFSFGFGPRSGLTFSLIKLGTLFSADFEIFLRIILCLSGRFEILATKRVQKL